MHSFLFCILIATQMAPHFCTRSLYSILSRFTFTTLQIIILSLINSYFHFHNMMESCGDISNQLTFWAVLLYKMNKMHHDGIFISSYSFYVDNEDCLRPLYIWRDRNTPEFVTYFKVQNTYSFIFRYWLNVFLRCTAPWSVNFRCQCNSFMVYSCLYYFRK